jgi:peptidoglycan/LPS O-acetylase OafA/YrhL
VDQQIIEVKTLKAVNNRIPSLDGLRAFSILLVLMGHGAATVPAGWQPSEWSSAIIENSSLGVYVFFVISGFLITRLLMKERQKTGNISIKDFYIRRAFRIWPAFYVFWLAVLILGGIGAIQLHVGEAIAAGLYAWNYYPGGQTWFLGHTWSLAVEEQFYLLWPVTLRLLGNSRGRFFSAAVILLSPVVRVATYFLFPQLRGHIPIMLHTRMDSLMFGSLAALLYDEPRFQRFLEKCYWLRLPALAAIFVIFVSSQLARVGKGSYLLTVGWTIDGCCICLLLLWSIQHESSTMGKLLNCGPIVHLGLISYSLYLWNQLFLTPLNQTVSGRFPLNFFILFAVAECSYRRVEQPFLRLRESVVKRSASA